VGRPTINFDREMLAKAIQTVESTESFTSRDAMYSKAIETYRSMNGPEANKLTNVLVYQRVKQWNIPVLTAAGRKGRAPGTKVVRGPRERRQSANQMIGIKAIRKDVMTHANRPAIIKLVDRVEQGSLKAAIKLNCLYCANYDKEEVKNCECYECPL
jgi:hypothetical protein